MKRVYFTDFDGTITKYDTTDAMIETFATDGWQEILQQWQLGELTTKESARLFFKLLHITPEEAKHFLRSIPIDETFRDFVTYVENRKEKLYILSDGFDINIKTILEKAKLTHLTFYTNRFLIYKDHYDLETPYASSCNKCGTCKKTLVEKLKADAEQIIYIGDGISDICASQSADIIFAKEHLLQYCQTNVIPVIPFSSFNKVTKWLQDSE